MRTSKRCKKELPDKLYLLLERALIDAKECQKSNDYVLNMLGWHKPVGDKCHICLAGAVMAKSLGAPRNKDINLGFYRYRAKKPSIARKLEAIDNMRNFNFNHAYSLLYPGQFRNINAFFEFHNGSRRCLYVGRPDDAFVRVVSCSRDFKGFKCLTKE